MAGRVLTCAAVLAGVALTPASADWVPVVQLTKTYDNQPVGYDPTQMQQQPQQQADDMGGRRDSFASLFGDMMRILDTFDDSRPLVGIDLPSVSINFNNKNRVQNLYSSPELYGDARMDDDDKPVVVEADVVGDPTLSSPQPPRSPGPFVATIHRDSADPNQMFMRVHQPAGGEFNPGFQRLAGVLHGLHRPVAPFLDLDRPLDEDPEEQQHDQQHQQQDEQHADGGNPFVEACQDDVIVLCRREMLSQKPGSVGDCLLENFGRLTRTCSRFVRDEVLASRDEPGSDAHEDDMVDDGADGEEGDDEEDDGMSSSEADTKAALEATPTLDRQLLACQLDADVFCSDEMKASDADELSVQRCLVRNRARISSECSDLLSSVENAAAAAATGNDDMGAAAGSNQAAPVPVDSTMLGVGPAPGPSPMPSFPATPTMPPAMPSPEPPPMGDIPAPPAGPSGAAAQVCVGDVRELCASEKGHVRTLACLHRSSGMLTEQCAAALKELPAFHCAEDAANLCEGADSRREIVRCLRDNMAEVSEECRDSIDKHRSAMHSPIVARVKEGAAAIRSQISRGVQHASSNPVPVAAGAAGLVALAALGVVVSRRRRARTRRSDDDKDSAENVAVVVSRGAAQVRSRPGVLLPSGPAEAH